MVANRHHRFKQHGPLEDLTQCRWFCTCMKWEATAPERGMFGLTTDKARIAQVKVAHTKHIKGAFFTQEPTLRNAMVRALESGAHLSAEELAEAVGRSLITVWPALRIARKLKLIYVADWAPTKTSPKPLYAWNKTGRKKDKKPPPPTPKHIINRNHRRRNAALYNLKRKQKKGAEIASPFDGLLVKVNPLDIINFNAQLEKEECHE